MVRNLLLASALLASAPALAQEAAQPQMQPQQGVPSSAVQPAQPAQPQAAQPAPTPATTASAIASIVDSEFAAYDVDKNGQLDQAEFSRWMVALKDQEMKSTGATLPADKLTAWVNGAFTTADKDKSVTVSKPELITYLSNGAV